MSEECMWFFKGEAEMIIKPEKLNIGDRVAVIAPSSAASESAVQRGEKMLEAMGLVPVMYPTCYTKHGHMSAPDGDRAKDVNDAFGDKSIKGVICLGGGYGVLRILNLIDYDLIRNNPKVFVGYSDATGLHIAFNKICRMVTYHGFMAVSSIYKKKKDKFKFHPYTFDSIKKNLFTNEAPGVFENPEGELLGSLYGGKAEGELIGGNLTILAATLGSPYEIDVKGKILFIEEIGEPVHKVDYMLTSLSLAGKFDDCSGIILGTWPFCDPEERDEGLSDLPLSEIFNEILLPYKKPVITNFRAGHNNPHPVLAFGTKVALDADKKEIVFTG